MFREVVNVVVHHLQVLVGDRHRRCRRVDDFSFEHVVDGGILNYLAINVETRDEWARCQRFENGVARCTHTTLNGQELWRDAPGTDVARQQLCNVLADLCCSSIGFVERPRLLGDASLDDARNLPGLDGYEVITYTVVRSDDGDGHASEAALCGLVGVVQASRVGIMIGVVFDDDVACQPHHRCCDASCRREECLADVLPLDEVGNLDNGPVYLSIEAVTQALGHMSQVHILVVDFALVGVDAEVLVGRERRAKPDGLRSGEVALDALARRCSREQSHLKRLSTLVQGDSPL